MSAQGEKILWANAEFPYSEEFERITEGLSDALEFTRTIGLGKDSISYEQGGGRGALGEVDFYTRSVRASSLSPSSFYPPCLFPPPTRSRSDTSAATRA